MGRSRRGGVAVVGLLICCCSCTAVGQQSADSSTASMVSFQQAGIVPQILAKEPTNLLEVTYAGQKMEPGSAVPPSSAAAAPSLSLHTAAQNKLYTLVMMDPDAPSRQNPKAAQWLHWLIINISGESLRGGSVVPGDVLTEYNGPTPPKGSGPHRYVLAVYEQQGGPLSVSAPSGRPKFNMNKFAQDNKLGSPVAATFFTAENK